MLLPDPRGAVSAELIGLLHRDPSTMECQSVPDTDAEDLQLSLWVCYELCYRGFEGVDPDWDGAPALMTIRRVLENRWLGTLRGIAAPERVADVPRALAELVAADEGPPLAKFLQTKATAGQFAEFVAHRSVYHLKEADPHSWAIPRLSGRAKAALVEIQADEYGQGQLERMHSELFRATMRSLGLDDAYGHYVGQAPATTLAVSNLMSLFGLNRRWLGAALGHLAVFEMTSSLPNRRYGNGLRRLGGDATATRFFDEHVEADAVHEQIAAHDLCGSYAADNPEAAGDILFGAACALTVEARFGTHLLDRWTSGKPSLPQSGLPGAA